MKRLAAAWTWLRVWRDWWPLALRSTLEHAKDAAEVEIIQWADRVEAEQRKVEVALRLLEQEVKRRETLSATLDSLAIIRGFGPSTEDVAS